MTFSSFVSRDTLKLKKRITVQTTKGSRKRIHAMSKTVGSADYHSNLQTFLHTLAEAQMRAHQDDSKIASVGAYHETGRKFDKVYFVQISKSGKATKDVRYFIQRSDGTIYGAKSPMAPNLRWQFGTIYESDLWNWEGFHGVPKDLVETEDGERVSLKTGVKVVGAYGDYMHYEPMSKKEANAAAENVG